MTLERYPAPPVILAEGGGEKQVANSRRTHTTSLRTLVLERARRHPNGKVGRIVRDLNSKFNGARQFIKTWNRDCEPRIQARETGVPPAPACILVEVKK